MKKIIFLFSLIPLSGIGQNSLLWKVTSAKTKHTSYLFGSMHTNDSLLNTFDKTWWNAFNSCDVFAGELNATDTAQLMGSMMDMMMKDTVLADLYTEEELKRVNRFIIEKTDVATAMVLTRLKPFYIMAAIMEIPDESGPYTEVMDIRLQRIAFERKKKVVGLETNSEQAASVGAMSLKEQAKMLLEFVDVGNVQSDEMKKLEGLYRLQQLDEMHYFAMIYSTPEMPEKMMDALIDERNHRFFDRLSEQLSTSSVFCAVGALHLPGETGLINLLRTNGYTVEPVNFNFGE